MKLDNMFKKSQAISGKEPEKEAKAEVPEGLLRKCNLCKKVIFAEDVEKGYYICPKCGGYYHMPALERIRMIADEGSFEEWDRELKPVNPMRYKGYLDKLRQQQEKTGLKEAVVTGKAKIDGTEAVFGVCDSRFLMASMGENVGEKIARAVERATKMRLPVILFAASGGARMQEGIVSLMQMAKTSAVLKRHSEAGLLYISVLTDPTTGGVTASFAMLGDIILAEPGALIGFAGPRVIEQTIGQKLPKGFQRSEFLLEHGFLDGIVERKRLRESLSQILKLHEVPGVGKELLSETMSGQVGKESFSDTTSRQVEKEISSDAASTPTGKKKKKRIEPWDRVLKSRKSDRPSGSDYIKALFTDFVEFHGDRAFGDDAAVAGGIARFHGMPVTVIAQEKGKGTKENIAHNFGMPKPEGYRKALRLMKQAEKFGRPVICFVDTPGAFCGIEAEERGQGEAIARNIYEMSALSVPVLSIFVGEGGSGGALALAVADEVWILENAVYSILSPEGFSSILWKDSSKAKEAAKVMKMTAENLYRQNIVEQVFEEPEELTTENIRIVTDKMEREIQAFLGKYGALSGEKLLEHRYQRFRKL
ncbi:MAG: acetyl-CoA carboxylase carboxyltransferase subunit beta [Lachnospiraceae bacterium]|nr:acetyl-CoA carboxylase carboxyltransferase subunit beta [Lachnospiraceae bacterium]